MLTWTGLSGGISQWPQARTPGQRVQTITQFAYGIFALLSLLTAFRGRRWNRLMLGVWLACLTLAGGLAAVFWGASSVPIGLLAGASTLLVGLCIAWLLRAGTRGPNGG